MKENTKRNLISRVIGAGGSMTYNTLRLGTHTLADSRHIPIAFIEGDEVDFTNPEFDLDDHVEWEENLHFQKMCLVYIKLAIQNTKSATAYGRSEIGKPPLPTPLAREARLALIRFRDATINSLKQQFGVVQ
jgi:hypothetical protein